MPWTGQMGIQILSTDRALGATLGQVGSLGGYLY